MLAIDYDIVGQHYQRFIRLAIERSDAILLVNRKIRIHLYKSNIPAYLCEDIDMAAYQTNLEWRSVADLQRYNDNCIEYMEKLQPFLIHVRHNTVWPSTQVGACDQDEEGFDICLYRSCGEIEPLLLQPRRLYGWMYPDFPEDLCLFTKNACWFHTTSHEEQAFLHVDNEVEVSYWEEQGLTFTGVFDAKLDVEMRYMEEYQR